MREHVRSDAEKHAPQPSTAAPAARLSLSSPAAVLRLQRAAGNRAVAALARTAAAPPTHNADSELTQAEIDGATQATRTGPASMVASTCTDWCFTPLPLSGPLYAGAWGILAHAFISWDYETVMRVTRGAAVYFDNSFAGPIDPGYGAFVARKNPGNVIAPVFFATTPVKRPDALLHDSRTEFDEFKPDSIAGRFDGNVKLALIDAYMGLLGLPYHRGTSYTPTPRIPILTTSLRGVPIELSLKLRRDSAGLIVYEYCICTDWALLTKAAVIALIIFLIWLIIRGTLPVPVPIPVPA